MTKCAGCGHEFKSGDLYIEDTSSGFTGQNSDDGVVDNLISDIFGGTDGKILLCENCTEPGVGYIPQVFA